MTIRDMTKGGGPIIHWRVWELSKGQSEKDAVPFITKYEEPEKAGREFVEWNLGAKTFDPATDIILGMRRAFPKGDAYRVSIVVETEVLVGSEDVERISE